MKLTLKVLICLAAILCARTSDAQITYEGCTDFRGQPVASVLDYSINDVAIALIENGNAVIRYNPRVLAQMSAPTRQFFYIHECAHHALGHTITTPTLARERAADCWAARTMFDEIGLSESDLMSIRSDISRLSSGDWTHLPGTLRFVDIETCLGIKLEPREHRKVPCMHRVPCQHGIPCSHRSHLFDTMHPFDLDFYGNRYPCTHQIQCGHFEHQFDTQHMFDTEHEFDYE